MSSFYTHPSIVIEESGGFLGKGVFAIQDIPAGKVIASVHPQQFIIYDLKQYYEFQELAYKLQIKDEIILFALYLAYIEEIPKSWADKFKKQKAYLKSLPQKFHNLICWCQEELDFLQNSKLKKDIIKKQQKIQQQFSQIRKILIEVMKSNYEKFQYRFFTNVEEDMQIIKNMSINLIFKMYSVIVSRNLYYGSNDDPYSSVGAIVPLIEMFNHSNFNQISVELSRENYDAKTIKQISKGEQLFVKYGEYQDEQFLQWYGFLPGNQHEFSFNHSKNQVKYPYDNFRKILALEYKKRRKLKDNVKK